MRLGAIAIAIAVLSASNYARADLEGVARLYFEAAEHGDGWVEGFSEGIDGQQITYNSHRDGDFKARIVRAQGQTISWKTAAVVGGDKQKEVTFLWVAAMADKGTHEKFELVVNGRHKIGFVLGSGWSWSVEGEGGGRLSFAAEMRDGSEDLFGYMKLTVPADWVQAGQCATLQMTGIDAASSHWVLTHEYTDAKADLLKRLPKDVFFEYMSEGPQGGSLKLIARGGLAGKTAVAHAGGAEAGKAQFGLADDLAIAFVPLPASTLKNPRQVLSVLVDSKEIGKMDLLPLARYRLRAFLAEELEADNYIITPGKFPGIQWKHPDKVAANMGRFELKTTFYDADMKEVGKADKPGRYGAVVSAVTPDGFEMKRYITLYCIPERFHWEDQLDLTARFQPKFGIPESTWKARGADMDNAIGKLVLAEAGHNESFAAFLAGIKETAGGVILPAHQAEGLFRDRQWWVTFKRRQAGVEGRYKELHRPTRQEQSATVLKEGDPANVGYSADNLGQMDEICRQWVAKGGAPVSVLAACKGTIVFHKAYGKTPDGRDMTIDTCAPLASTTKMITGIMIMEFVDQGLLSLDEPAAKHLSELDRRVERAMTVRHMLTHTAGFDSYGEWGMDYSNGFENAVGQFLPCLETGKRQYYNGNSYALAGKLMERISGKCVPYLFREHLLEPLGSATAQVTDCGGGCTSTVLDLARIGQMMLNKGAYGHLRFFSEENCARMLPQSLESTIGLKIQCGLGLQRDVFGLPYAGGMSGSSVRYWPEKELVIAICRFRTDPDHSKFVASFVQACAAPLGGVSTQPAKAEGK